MAKRSDFHKYSIDIGGLTSPGAGNGFG